MSERDLNSEFLAIHEFIPAAHDACTDEAWNYLIGGTETETTVARNRAALDAVAISPQVIADTLGAILKYQDDIAMLHGSEASRILEDAKKRLEPA